MRAYYAALSVPITHDGDQYSTDFGKALKQVRSYGNRGETTFVPSDVPDREHIDTAAYDFGDVPDYGVINEVLVLGGIGGRVDQGLGLLHEFAREQARWPGVRIVLISESSVSFIVGGGAVAGAGPVQPGSEERLTSDVVDMLAGNGHAGSWHDILARNMGIVPILGPARIWTKGLEWDVQDWATEMGKMVSTSNHVVEDEVEVWTTRPVLFTVERLPV